MAGIRSDAIARATGSERVVRAMPNTPALIGEGIAGLFARAAVTPDDRSAIERVLAPTGETLWVAQESDLDAVTALSGSGPAYVFFFLEAMMQAAADMGLGPEQGRRLALATFKGATSLARASDESPETLRSRVTSKGGTTYAAITAMESAGVKPAIVAGPARGAGAREDTGRRIRRARLERQRGRGGVAGPPARRLIGASGRRRRTTAPRPRTPRRRPSGWPGTHGSSPRGCGPRSA